MLSFSLLGRIAILKNGETLTRFRSQKESALLIYLAHTGQACRRDFIADLLWETNSTKQALSNLRTVLARLRKKVGDALIVTRQTIALEPESRRQVDSAHLLQILASMDAIQSLEEASALQNALGAYRGEFLEGFDLPNAPRFMAWVTTTRAHIHRQVTAGYDRLGQYALSTGDVENGCAVARRWLQVDALNETAHTLLLRLLLKAGKTREAITHYNHCAALLQEELGVSPPVEMAALIERARFQPIRLSPATAVRHNLPSPHDQFFGREAAQQEIHTRLDQPWCRLVTITGQGGVGKTRLVTVVARSRLSQYRDGVWLVELAELDPNDDDLAEAIAVEIAIALDLRLTGAAKPTEQLLNHLQHKQMMLVLDNFEHVLDGMQIVLDIVQRCENVQIIVTAREPLGVRAEWVVALTGLTYPANDMDERLSDAVKLFVARRAQHQRGVVSAVEMTAVQAICRMVQGLPLAIELAAALTRRAAPQAIADNLRDSFDALAARLRDVPERHRSLNVVFEMSWRTLTPTLQQDLARLSIFRGGFTETAAAQIAAALPDQLAALREKSLLVFHEATERYTLHPVIRAYAAQKRAANDPVPQEHGRYYLQLLAQHAESLQKEKPRESMRALEPEIGNIRRAWQTGLGQRYLALLSAALTPLSTYYQLRGLAREGAEVMQTTFRAAKSWGDEACPLAVRAGLERARFQNRLGQCQTAVQTIKTALKLAAQCADSWAQSMGRILWGEALWRLGEYDTAVNKLTQALNMGRDLDDLPIIGWGHHHLGIVHDIQGRYDAARDHLEEACAVWRTLGNAQALSGSLNSIGLVCYHEGDLAAAQQAMEQAFSLCEQMDDRHRQSLIVNNLSILATEQGDYMGAQYYLQLGLQLAARSGDLYAQGSIYVNLGRVFSLQGDDEAAVRYLETGQDVLQTIGEPTKLAEAAVNLADAKRRQGDLPQAESLYHQTLAIARENDLPRIECAALIGMTELLNELDREQAEQWGRKAVALASSIQNPQLLERAHAVAHDSG